MSHVTVADCRIAIGDPAVFHGANNSIYGITLAKMPTTLRFFETGSETCGQQIENVVCGHLHQ